MCGNSEIIVVITVIRAKDDTIACKIIQLQAEGKLPSFRGKFLYPFSLAVIEIDAVIGSAKQPLLKHEFRKNSQLHPGIDHLEKGNLEVVGIPPVDGEPARIP